MLGYTSGKLTRRRMTVLRLMPPQDGKTEQKCSRMKATVSALGRDVVTDQWPMSGDHDKGQQGRARRTTSVFEDVFEKRDLQALLAVAPEIIRLET